MFGVVAKITVVRIRTAQVNYCRSVVVPLCTGLTHRHWSCTGARFQSARGIGPASIQPGEFSNKDKVDGENKPQDAASNENSTESHQAASQSEEFPIVTQPNTENEVEMVRIRKEVLSLVEEVPLPQRVLTDLELIMTAWSEEHARHYAMLLMIIRAGMFILLFIIVYVFYITQLSSERVLRGVDNMPADLRIGAVVYFDLTVDGMDLGRIVIGLLNEDCPLYCEYFHRRCTGSGDTGDSFRGMQLSAIVPRHALIFGDGIEMTHGVPGFNPNFLPTEHVGNGSWRGAVSSIATGEGKESPNFVIHASAGDYSPQIFGLIIGGFNVIERINSAGSSYGNNPKKTFTIKECGELCTLAKSHIMPMPWKLYDSVSNGYDSVKFGEMMSPEVLEKSDARWDAASHVGSAVAQVGDNRKRSWWHFW